MDAPASQRKITTEKFSIIRQQSEKLCAPLEIEDFVAQPVVDVSPPRWHLAHTTWFFETFILVPRMKGYKLFHPRYPFLFNSYYVQAGERWQRAERGYLTRPTVKEILAYRNYVNEHVLEFLENTEINHELAYLMELGFQHEQQHQELLLYDIKYILGHNPLFPEYARLVKSNIVRTEGSWRRIESGNYQIGYSGNDFHFDNEKGIHTVFLHDFEIADRLVTKGEYLEFLEARGYEKTELWLDEGWKWVAENEIKSPMYWVRDDGGWMEYTLNGLQPIDKNDPLVHVSFYEADAYARWKGVRLPTEHEWEVACKLLNPKPNPDSNFVESELYGTRQEDTLNFFGNVWEWTASAYRPYPFYEAPEGALGEYNGKFMINQMVLRGGSFATPANHIRSTYRNFFHPHLRWLFSGIRLARHI